jgi:hypothetical protein
LAALGERASALRAAESVLAQSRAIRGKDHPDTIACTINVGQARQTVDDSALRNFEAAFGPSHPQVTAARTGEWLTSDIEPPPT